MVSLHFGFVELDEDALARAVVGGRDDGVDPTYGHVCETLRTAGVVAHPAPVAHVGDPVLEDDKHLGAVVRAQPVAGAQVLVDPHPHAAPTLWARKRVTPVTQMAEDGV